ncbi:MAG: hypothetical protein ACK4M3_01770, partial [Pyrobaculum sp.]
MSFYLKKREEGIYAGIKAIIDYAFQVPSPYALGDNWWPQAALRLDKYTLEGCDDDPNSKLIVTSGGYKFEGRPGKCSHVEIDLSGPLFVIKFPDRRVASFNSVVVTKGKHSFRLRKSSDWYVSEITYARQAGYYGVYVGNIHIAFLDSIYVTRSPENKRPVVGIAFVGPATIGDIPTGGGFYRYKLVPYKDQPTNIVSFSSTCKTRVEYIGENVLNMYPYLPEGVVFHPTKRMASAANIFLIEKIFVIRRSTPLAQRLPRGVLISGNKVPISVAGALMFFIEEDNWDGCSITIDSPYAKTNITLGV